VGGAALDRWLNRLGFPDLKEGEPMPAERVPMRYVREILRLRAEGLSDRAIARSVRLARGRLCRSSGRGRVELAIVGGIDGHGAGGAAVRAWQPGGGARRKPEPDWASLHRELRRPGVTLMLLWQEYRASAPEGYGYSRFCELYDEWESRLSPTMRQVHPAGERLFVDYAGQTIELIDGGTGEVHQAQVFVAASSYTYAEATPTQTLPDWIGGLNPTYQDFATHYGTAILPARPRRPRDKAKVEVGVQVVERWTLRACGTNGSSR
jgi:hypothetical protein